MKPTFGGIDPPSPAAAAIVALAASGGLVFVGQPAVSGSWALLASVGLWWLLWGLPPRAAALAALVILLPIPTTGFAGVRALDTAAWITLSLGWSALYALAGALAAQLAARWVPHLPRPVPWFLTWSGVDQGMLYAPLPLWPLPLPYGYAFADTALVATAALLGPSGLGAAGSLVGLTGAAWLRSWGGASPPARRTALALTLAAIALALALTLVTTRAASTPLRETRSVAITQVREPGLTDSERLARFQAIAAPMQAGLHIWPEAAVRVANATDLATLARAVEGLTAPLLVGALRATPDGGDRNGALFADRHTLRWVYEKERLVPHFEAHLQAGVGERWPIDWQGWRVGVLICWESLFYALARQRVQSGAEVLVVLAHAGWAGESASGWWHAQVARVLAWSLGVPVIFASHEGPSLVWTHAGRLLAALHPGTQGMAVAVALPERWSTPYRSLGGRGVVLLWGVAVLLVLALARTTRGGGVR